MHRGQRMLKIVWSVRGALMSASHRLVRSGDQNGKCHINDKLLYL
jgi:hypothetical protein